MRKFNSLLKFLGIVLCFGVSSAFAQSISFTLTQAPCNANGILTANFTGLTPPLAVNWGGTIHTGITGMSDALTGYNGARISVIVTDANNATAWGFYQGAPPFVIGSSSTQAVCPASGTATATIVSGGTAPFTYQWTDIPGNTVVSTSNPASLPAGQYDVMVTDANGCVFGTKYYYDSAQTINIYNSSNINFTINSTQANCTNGTATVAGFTGGTAPYSILWSNAATSASITGLTMGVYGATVTDANGCYTKKNVYVSQSKNIGTNMVSTPATCVQNNGSVTSFGSGGVPPYSYLWNNSATTQSISGLAPGIYAVKVTDANGCIGTGNRYVSSSTPVNVTYTTVASSCTSPTGSATLNISGGTTPYSVQWYTFPAQTGNTAIGLPAGLYSFKVTDAVGCVRTGTVTIPPVNVISLAMTTVNATCTQSNGSISVTPTGGTAPYSYVWSNTATTSSVTGLATGQYWVNVTDNAGCTVKKYQNVSASSPISLGIVTSPASCLYSSNGTATATASGGTAPYSYLWNNSGTGPNINGLKRGSYTVDVTDAVGCKARAYTYVNYNPNNNSCYCTITGVVYNDLNANCTQDGGEQGIPNIQVHCSGYGYAYTNANGVYSFKVPTGTYTITETVLGYYPLASCQANSIVVNATAGANCTHTVNFANTVNPIHDMYIHTWNYNCAVPGYTYKQIVLVKNNGTVTEGSVAAGYKSDGQILTPVFSPSGMFTGSGTQYNIGGTTLSLAPGVTQHFLVNYNMPANIPLNTSLVFKDTTAYTSPMSNWLNDYSPWNNVNYHNPVVVGSYDPNFKEVSPKGNGPTGVITRNDTTLEYMVHFQNLGTYKAQNIYILDTLDADLDWQTMTPVYQSHKCEITMDENGVIRFQFDNIDLPAEINDEPGSHGLVTYTVKTKKGLPIGTQFKNSAAIYFDFNEPVITNTTTNTLGELSVEEARKTDNGKVSVYPNPTHDIFTVRIKEGNYQLLKVINTLGQVYATERVIGNETRIDLSAATPGIYFIILQGSEGSRTEKVEKL